MAQTQEPDTVQEREAKLSSTANSQLKLLPVLQAEAMLAKLRTACDVLGIELGESYQVKIRDEYLDDPDLSLFAQGLSLRHRREGDASELTLKTSQLGAPSDNKLSRLEVTWRDADDILALRQDPSRVLAAARERGAPVAHSVQSVSTALVVDNDRLVVPASTSIGRYKLNYDKFHFYGPTAGFSEMFAEFEIEAEETWPEHDHTIRGLQRLIQVLLDFEVSDLPKYRRGVQWLQDPHSGAKNVYAIGFDIVGYSRHAAVLQKQLIQRLNLLVKRSFEQLVGEGRSLRDSLLYLPTGDGMLVVVDKWADKILPVLVHLQSEIKASNAEYPPGRRLLVRTALHAGPVFTYTDINEHLNFAGNGLNLLARALTVGDDRHVVATEAALEHLAQPYGYASWFRRDGVKRVKHGVDLLLYNVTCPERDFGNPTTLGLA